MTLQSRSHPKSHATSGTNPPGRLRLDQAGRQSGTEVQGPSSPDVRSPPPRPPPSRSLASPPSGTPGGSPLGPLHWPDAPPGGPSRPSSPSTVPPSPRGVPSVLLIRQASSFHTQLCNGQFAPPPHFLSPASKRASVGRRGSGRTWSGHGGGTLVKGTGVLTQGPSLCHVGTWRAADCVRADGCPQARARWRPDGGPSASGSARNPFPLLVHSGVPLTLFCNV